MPCLSNIEKRLQARTPWGAAGMTTSSGEFPSKATSILATSDDAPPKSRLSARRTALPPLHTDRSLGPRVSRAASSDVAVAVAVLG
jgi:hypothetical protein